MIKTDYVTREIQKTIFISGQTSNEARCLVEQGIQNLMNVTAQVKWNVWSRWRQK